MSTAAPSPRVRQPASAVSWFELFYDLLVVASLGLVNDTFLRHPSALSARDALIGFVALSWVWFLTALFNNVFPGQDLVRRVLMLIQMALIIVAALTIERSVDEVGQRAMWAYAGALSVVPVLIVIDRWLARGRPTAPPSASLPLFAAVGLIVVGGFLGQPALVPLLIVGVLVSMVAVLGRDYRTWRDDSRLRLDHLRERLGLFILIILGEGFAQLVGALHALGDIPRAGVFALTFLVSFALWWIYFDGTFSDGVDLHRVRWRLSLLGHLTLVIGMAGTLDILVLLAVTEESAVGGHVFEYFAFCIALALASFALLRFAATGRLGFPGLLQLISAGGVSVAGILLGEGGTNELDVLISVSAVLVIANAAVSARRDSAP